MNNVTTTADGSEQQHGFGAKLMAARAKQGLSVEQVASELNILKRHVEAIESQHYEALPQFAFARGFVASYAKFVGLPTNEVIKEFENDYPKHLRADTVETIKSPVQPMGTLTRGRAPVRLNLGLIFGIGALLLLALGILNLISGTKTTIATQEETPVQVVDGLSASEQAQGAAVANTGSAVGITTFESANTQSTLSQPTTSATDTLSSNVGELELWVKDKTPITVKDSTGAILMTGEQSRGGYELKGIAPFLIDVDSPHKVSINFNKNPVDMKPYGTTKATLTLQ